MAKILIVEDDLSMAETLENLLSADRHDVEVAYDGEAALEKLQFYKFDLVVLDRGLPKVTGLEVCRQFRHNGGMTPILFLTALDSVTDKESGLDCGADDYLAKPFHRKELMARVRALLRRPHQVQTNILQARDIEIDCNACTVTRGGELIHLTPKEFALLTFFLRHPNVVFSAQAILDRVWTSESDATSDTLRSYITRLRSKIDSQEQSLIKTVHKQGYMLEP